MEVQHVISTIDNASGGPSSMIINLLSSSGRKYPNVIMGLNTALTKNALNTDFNRDNLEFNFYKRDLIGRLIGFKKILNNASPDIFHGHGIWQLPVHQMSNVARKLSVPYVISPHGMLGIWSLNQRKLKKILALRSYQKADLKGAACLVATAEAEAKEIRSLGYKNPIAVIPNGIALEQFTEKDYGSFKEENTVLFLSRIVENKGLSELIQAWSQVSTKLKAGWKLRIVGNGEEAYIRKLKTEIVLMKQEHEITIEGPLYGKEKIKAFQRASLFVLPTYSENFGLVVAEALACGTPVITTKGAPWSDISKYECGHWIDMGSDPLRKALEMTLSQSSKSLEEMGKKGRRLIEEKYSMDSISSRFIEMYDWILNNNIKPEFIY